METKTVCLIFRIGIDNLHSCKNDLYYFVAYGVKSTHKKHGFLNHTIGCLKLSLTVAISIRA